MRVLVTGAASALGQEVAAALATDENAQLRLIDDCAAQRQDVEWIEGRLTDSDAVRQAVRDVDVVVHTGEPPPAPESEDALLDHATRGTHVLLQTAVEAGVKRFVYGSTLEVFRAYPDTVYVTEYYKPLPPPELAVLARYLGEITCREFAREYLITVTALRLGKLVREEEVAGRERDLMWVDIRDAAQAFCAALARDSSASLNWVPRWAVYHIVAPIAHPKFLLDRAKSMGYQPQREFLGGKV
ncbi:MAG: NAD(P)-dependent oxidoreductase [Candidatus Latescibacteria bacterium]|nr:NAD(P)-dependent oxidoreductase [Candidatus Latescibacterota bacterium]